MTYFIRFSETIEADIKRSTSILTNRENMIVEGLCAFYGGETIEDCHKRAILFGQFTANEGDTYSIISGVESKGPSGSLGTVVLNSALVSSHILKLK